MRLSILLVICLTALCSVQAQQITIQGKITDREGNMLPGVIVSLEPAGGMVTSDDHGGYRFSALAAGQVTLTARIVGYKLYKETFRVSAGVHTRDIRMEVDKRDLQQVNVISQRVANANAESLIKVENSIMPVTIIDRRTIELMGSRRLDDVLKEQTGVAIVNDIGAGSRSIGVQMQGFGSEYVMVLIDGQPMIGRNSGNFDLSRISVSNIERVEITKGAASNLYGGDALGGTINIITRHIVADPQAMAAVIYGSNETLDVTAEGESPILKKKGSVSLSSNYYHTGGFNTSTGTIKGTTAPPYDNYATQGRFRYRFNDNNLLSVSGRFGLRRSFMTKDFGASYITKDVLDEQDLNLSAAFDHRFSNRWRSMTRYYFTRYNADMSIALTQGDSVSQTAFGQTLHRAEQQVSYAVGEKLDIVGGAGGNIEHIDQNILTDVNDIKSYFAYTQANWRAISKMEFTLGLRYDHIVAYGWRLDPSMALQYKILPTLRLKAAYGTGFKAPDMKKLYQVFYNPSYNYMVVGSAVIRNIINQMMESGQISKYELEPVYNEIKGKMLEAEMSKSYNFSLNWEAPSKKVKAEGSVFYHDITNQINSVLIGTDINGRALYSYRNNAKAYYKGIEASVSYTPLADLNISAGYQYLIAKDKTIEEEIREGGKYYAPLFDPKTGYVNYTPSAKDYWGLENRSRHMFNVRAVYTYQPWRLSGNVRVNYRGRYPFADRNNNGYIDRFDTFVRGYYLLNAGLEKKLVDSKLSLRFNAENLLNFIDPKVPSQAGRLFFAGIAYHLR
ncbi:outer membrane receptor for ferrienterochelin and colicins [Chitinophaga sp. YR627]|uniref:TonB-dependent receptor n=1 Tax=Chitinophaga sp. YR627 TaxID=1881041 RepID=UPI0008E59650|nr:TonB-dependent receptor [Chitinophaga sp. YR627]SFN32111.1 outer membrane receptor for ferrienterochelin and colicins [Chitinophaga sp. YR627]